VKRRPELAKTVLPSLAWLKILQHQRRMQKFIHVYPILYFCIQGEVLPFISKNCPSIVLEFSSFGFPAGNIGFLVALQENICDLRNQLFYAYDVCAITRSFTIGL